MKPNLDPDEDDALLDAILHDQTWQAASAAFKAEALRRCQARQRRRQLMRVAGSALALAAVIAGTAYWFAHPAPSIRQGAAASAEASQPPQQLRNLTDAELVAAFPKGSCFVAEVDGKKELVFFDPEMERAFVARPDGRGN